MITIGIDMVFLLIPFVIGDIKWKAEPLQKKSCL